MTSRWFTVLLSLFLAVPLCCCGWHGVKVDAEVAKTEIACPMCQVAADSASTDKKGCPCASDLMQRGLVAKASSPTPPAPVFASLPDTLHASTWAPMWTQAALLRRSSVTQSQGPPRLYLTHRALLC